KITTLSQRTDLKDEDYAKELEILLMSRNLLIENYFLDKGWTVQGQLLITRHPESTGLDKMAGLSPDATPSERGVKSLEPKPGEEAKHASNFMHLLLRTPEKPVKFARSNMIRGGMLCNMIMHSPQVKVASCANKRDF